MNEKTVGWFAVRVGLDSCHNRSAKIQKLLIHLSRIFLSWLLLSSACPFAFASENDPANSFFEFAVPRFQFVPNANSDLVVTIVRTGATNTIGSVLCLTEDATAQAGKDFLAQTGIIVFPLGQRTRVYRLPILKNPSNKFGKWFKLKLSSPVNGELVKDTAEMTVQIDTHEQPMIYSLGSGPRVRADGKTALLLGQRDGKVLIGGAFAHVNGAKRRYLARFNPDGSLDESFALDSRIVFGYWDFPKVLLEADGKLLLGGVLALSANPLELFSVARLNMDGSLDETFVRERLGREEGRATLEPAAMAVLPNGRIAVAGSYDQPYAGRLLMLDRDGKRDPAFGVDFNWKPNTLRALPDTSMLLSGLATINGQPVPSVVHLTAEGMVDRGFPRQPISSGIIGIEVQQDGGVLLNGVLVANGGQIQLLQRLQSDGTFDPNFEAPFEAQFSGRVAAFEDAGGQPILVHPVLSSDMVARLRILQFDKLGDVTRNILVQPVLPVGSWGFSSLASGFSTNKVVVAFNAGTLTPDSEIAEIGWFTLDSIPASGVRLVKKFSQVREDGQNIFLAVERRGDTSGAATVEYETADGTALAGRNYQPSSGMLAFGPGETTNSIRVPILDNGLVEGDTSLQIRLKNPSPGIQLIPETSAEIRIREAETSAAIDEKFTPEFNGPVRAVFPVSAQQLLVYGDFNRANREWRPVLVSLNSDGTLPIDSFLSDPIWLESFQVLQREADGHFLGISGDRLYRANADGSRDSNFVTVANAFLGGACLLSLSNGEILVGTTGPNYLVKFAPNGVLERTILGEGFSGLKREAISAILEDSDGKILIAGNFITVHHAPRQHVARLNSDGSLDTNFIARASAILDDNPENQLNGAVTSIKLRPDGKILIGGLFTAIGGLSRPGVALLNPDGSVDSSFAPAETIWVSNGQQVLTTHIESAPNGKVVVGREVRNAIYNYETVYEIVRLNADGSLDTNFFVPPILKESAPLMDFVMESDGALLLFGGELRIDGLKHFGLVRLRGEGSRHAQFNFAAKAFYASESEGRASVMVRRVGDLSFPATVKVNVNESEAGMFPAQEGTLIFGQLETEKTFQVLFKNDSLADGTHTATVQLREPSSQTGIGLGDATVNVFDDEHSGSLDFDFQPIAGWNATPDTLKFLGAQSDGSFWISARNVGDSLAGHFSPTGELIETRRNAYWAVVSPNGVPFYASWDGLRSVDGTLGPIPQGDIVSFLPDGEVLVMNRSIGRIKRYLSNGQRLTFAVTVSGPSYYHNSPETMLSLPDGRVVIGGSFMKVVTTQREFVETAQAAIVRINADGTLDSSFRSIFGDRDLRGEVGIVYQMLLQSDGKIVASGLVLLKDSEWKMGVVRLNGDGSLDESFQAQPGAFRLFGIFPDGRFLTSGPNGEGLSRLNTDGTADASFLPWDHWKTEQNTTLIVDSAHIQTDGKVVAIGRFSSLNGVSLPGIVRFNVDLLPKLSRPEILADSAVRVRWTAPRFQRSVLEASADLSSWFPLSSTNSPSGVFFDAPSNSVDPQRFYRLKLEPLSSSGSDALASPSADGVAR